MFFVESVFRIERLRVGDSFLVKMEITRKTEITIETRNKVVVHLPEAGGKKSLLCLPIE